MNGLIGFNPCFPGSSAESWTRYRQRSCPTRVSILVFLDQALKAAKAGESEAIQSGFNPCFPGSSAERPVPVKLTFADKCFNPCFPGSSAEREPSGLWTPPAQPVSILVFLDQALKVQQCERRQTSLGCFNPCFPGSSAESLTHLSGLMMEVVSILVFLDQALKVFWNFSMQREI